MSFFSSRTNKPESEYQPSALIPKKGERFMDSFANINPSKASSDVKEQEESVNMKSIRDQKEEEVAELKSANDSKEQEESVDFRTARDEKGEEEMSESKTSIDAKEQEEMTELKTPLDSKEQEELTECKKCDAKEEEETMNFKSIDNKENEASVPGAAIAGAAAGAASSIVGAGLGAVAGGAAGSAAGALAAPPPVVTFDTVNSPTTPATMAAKRLPPRVENPINYTVANSSATMNDIEISVENGNATNGNANLNGAAATKTKSSGVLKVKGTDQTTPGNAGKLRLVAKYGGSVVGTSNFFSISAIPQNWNSTFIKLITGAKRGFEVQDGWESDSGTFADLDQTEISEQVQYHSGTGIFKGVAKGNNSGYLPGNQLTTDSHGIDTAALTGIGTLLANQTCIFKDKRTNVTNIPMKNTGYNLSRDVTETAPKSGKFEITTSKVGGATTANGYSSNAGGGAAVSKKQAV